MDGKLAGKYYSSPYLCVNFLLDIGTFTPKEPLFPTIYLRQAKVSVQKTTHKFNPASLPILTVPDFVCSA